MATEEDKVEQTEEDVFAEAFGQAVAAADGAAPQEPEKKEEEEKDESADASKNGEGEAKGAAEGEGEKPEGELGGSPAKGESGDAGEPAKAVEDVAPSPNAELIEAIKALAPKQEAKSEPVKDEPRAPAAPEPFKFTEEEQKVLDSYNKEWDEHARAADLREKRLTHEITARMSQALDVVLQQIEQGLAPFINGHVQLSQERHITSVKQAHPDYEQLKPELAGWIEKQPKYLRAALQETYDKGNTEDVIELFTNFKKDTGRAQPQSSGTPPAKAAAKKDEVPADKVAELAPVTSKRSNPQPASSGVDPNDFDAGFADALREMAA